MTKKAEPEKFDLRSHDTASDKIAELLRLFPEIRTEGGKLDFDRLKLALGESVDVGRERYGMNWPGKADCFKTIQAPSMGTLRPCREESVNFDTTENMIIEGDNLEVLKLLQKSYLGKVKMIYIDPPYNTGNDFIYPDNYSESLQTYLEYTGQVDDEGRKFGSNTEADGRFHSKWMNMMYPRLYLAKNLLRDDGTIFISIDDSEVANLRKCCDDIFGGDNFLACVIWEKVFAPKPAAKTFSTSHDYVMVYSKSIDLWHRLLLPRGKEQDARYQNTDNDSRGPWASDNLLRNEHRDNSVYTIVATTGKSWTPKQGTSWRHPEEEMKRLIESNQIWFGSDGNGMPRRKKFLSEVQQGLVPETLWKHPDVGHTQEAKREIIELFGHDVFDTPKPSRLIKRAAKIVTSDSDIILDFFAGSGTVAHATLELNNEDETRRKFILVQLPERIETTDFATIADITKERVRRVIKQIEAKHAVEREKQKGKFDFEASESENPNKCLPPDLGFRVFKLDQSNFNTWNANVARESKAVERQLDLHIDHIRDARSPEDILYELLLKSGFPLSVQCSVFSFQNGKLVLKTESLKTENFTPKTENFPTVYSIASGALMICLDGDLTLELIRAIADLTPERVVFLDEGFAGNDQLKANAVQTFKTKGVASFRTV